MRKVAVFGNTGGGKSTLARRLAELTGLPLYILDIIQFRGGRYWPEQRGGGKVPHEEYLKIHGDILSRDRWIIDGYGSVASAWERFSVADTLVLYRPARRHALLGSHKALHHGPIPQSEGLAREQPGVGEHAGQLSGGLALPSRVDAEVS